MSEKLHKVFGVLKVIIYNGIYPLKVLKYINTIASTHKYYSQSSTHQFYLWKHANKLKMNMSCKVAALQPCPLLGRPPRSHITLSTNVAGNYLGVHIYRGAIFWHLQRTTHKTQQVSTMLEVKTNKFDDHPRWCHDGGAYITWSYFRALIGPQLIFRPLLLIQLYATLHQH